MAANNKGTQNQEELGEVAISINNGLQSNEFDTKPTSSASQSPEISNMSPSANKPPKYPPPNSPLIRRRTFKGKTRFGEPSIPLDPQTLENLGISPRVLDRSLSFKQSSPKGGVVSGKTAKEKDKKKEGPDEKEIYQRITSQLSARNRKRMTIKFLVQFLVFLMILACLVSSLVFDRFDGKLFIGVEIWKWFVLVMATFSGLLVTQWFVHVIVFFIEWKFLLTKNVVYFTHGLQGNAVVFIWACEVLVAWCVLFNPEAKTHRTSKKVLDFITMTLVTLLIGCFLWLLKTTFIKILASSFHLNRFFGRIQEAVFHHYVLQTLSGSPLVELGRKISKQESMVSFSDSKCVGKDKKVVDWTKLHKMKKEKVPSWTMKLLVDVVSNSGLSTMSDMLNENVVEGGVELDDNEISSEEAAIATAFRIFDNVVGEKPEPYIERVDLHRFMIWEEVNLVWQFFEVNEKGRIELKAFIEWVVKVYKGRRALQHCLNDNKTAVDELNKILIGILIIIMTILWLLLTNIVNTKLLLFISSQLLVAVFIFGNTCKTIFEAMIFVFVMHPFDVSDRCYIDGQMLLVEEMNILTTVFLRLDHQKVYYPNSVLATKPIGNFYRSPDQVDSFEFSIDYRTPLPKMAQLKERIKLNLEQNSNYWHPEHSLIMQEIENINKIKMALFFTHTMNFQDYAEKRRRKSELVTQLKEIFVSLEITYDLLPQKVLLSNIPVIT